jgi:hypothetical protein
MIHLQSVGGGSNNLNNLNNLNNTPANTMNNNINNGINKGGISLHQVQSKIMPNKLLINRKLASNYF